MSDQVTTPPSASTPDAAPSPAARPISAWLAVLVLLLIGGIFTFGFTQMIWLLVTHQLEVLNIPLATWAFTRRLAIASGSLVAIYGIYRRKRWGRWAGLVAIVGIGTWSFLRIDNEPYPNEMQARGAWYGQFVIGPLLYAWWAYAFAFSRKSRDYFASPRSEA